MIYNNEKYSIHDCYTLDFYKSDYNSNAYTLLFDNSGGFINQNQLVFSDCTVIKDKGVLNKWCMYDEMKVLDNGKIEYRLIDEMEKEILKVVCSKIEIVKNFITIEEAEKQYYCDLKYNPHKLYFNKIDLSFYTEENLNNASISINSNFILFPCYSIDKAYQEFAEKFETEKINNIDSNLSDKEKEFEIVNIAVKSEYDIKNFLREKFKPVFIKWAEKYHIPIRL